MDDVDVGSIADADAGLDLDVNADLDVFADLDVGGVGLGAGGAAGGEKI